MSASYARRDTPGKPARAPVVAHRAAGRPTASRVKLKRWATSPRMPDLPRPCARGTSGGGWRWSGRARSARAGGAGRSAGSDRGGAWPAGGARAVPSAAPEEFRCPRGGLPDRGGGQSGSSRCPRMDTPPSQRGRLPLGPARDARRSGPARARVRRSRSPSDRRPRVARFGGRRTPGPTPAAGRTLLASWGEPGERAGPVQPAPRDRRRPPGAGLRRTITTSPSRAIAMIAVPGATPAPEGRPSFPVPLGVRSGAEGEACGPRMRTRAWTRSRWDRGVRTARYALEALEHA